MSDLALFGVASDGSTDQWDGFKTVPGILLGWLQKAGIPFPPHGYDLWRARAVDPLRLVWDELRQSMDHRRKYDHLGHVVIESPDDFRVIGSALHVRPAKHVELTWPDPAWYLKVNPASQGAPSGQVRVEAFAGGKRRVVRTLSPGTNPLVLRTRGIERVRLSAPGAPGAVSSIGYGLLHDVRRRWLRIAHLSLPISNPAYPDAGTWTGSDEDEARRRVPVAVAADWTARYSTGFDDIHPYLEKLAIGQTASFPASADPDAPKSALEPLSAIMLAAAFDPHVRRIVGLGFDDTSVAMDGTEWAYQVTGQWDAPHLDVRVLSREAWSSVAGKVTASSAHGDLEFSGGGTVMKTESWSRPATLFFRPQPVDVVILTVGAVRAETLVAGLRGSRSAPAPGLVWRAFGPQGGELAEGAATLTAGSQTTIEIGARGIDRVEFGRPEGGPVTFVLYRIVARVAGVAGPGAILPSIFATEPGPPKSPGWISARPEQPDGTTPREPGSTSSLRAALEWELVASPEGVYDDAAPVLHQVAAHQLSTDPAAPKPAAVPFDEAYLLNDGRPVLVPSETAAVADVRRRYYTDKGLQEGWRSWWTRSVDWFGRVGEPSPPALERLEDHALPPPPDILHAEYVQADLPAEDAALLGRSWLGREWLSAHPSANAVAVAFGWSPERVAQAPDVDGFRVYVREPAIVTSAGPNEASERYEGVAWGPPRAQVGPIPVRFQGAVTNVAPGIQGVTVTAVTALDGTHAACATDLALDWGGGRLIGGVLASGGSTYLVAGNGDGANVSITVEHTAGAPPQPGAYDLLPGTSRIATVVTNLAPPPLAGAGIRRRASGVLAGATARLAVLGQDGGAFLCRIPPDVTPPAAGDAVTWFPAYSIVVPDTGFGPQASPARPTAHAQVTVRSVRRWSARPLESLDASPGRLTAVDATPPPAPFSFDFIPSGPHCAQVGTRANWYGVSYVTLGWASSPHLEYVVHRALGDAVMMLDAEVHATDPHVFPQSKWPPALWADTSRRAAVLSELAALDAALATANGAAIRSAYAGLGAGAQQLIAGQTEVEDAFVPLTEAPLQGSSFTDEVDGRSRAHWFYRLSARTRSGLESGKSLATPPICCPDVVPPAPPLGQLALATDGAVRIRWLISRDGDLSHYLLYRTDEDEAAHDVRDMDLVARISPSPTSTAGPDEVLPKAVPGRPWLEHDDPAPAGRDWIYRLVAVDTAGNRSEPSSVLRGRALLPPPPPPVWDPPVRGTDLVTLSWTHPSDQRLSCHVERRAPGGIWTAATDWLPRGDYSVEDRPDDLAGAWEYRLSVRDRLGQTASSMPVATLAAVT